MWNVGYIRAKGFEGARHAKGGHIRFLVDAFSTPE
jgi:hypothetical protein